MHKLLKDLTTGAAFSYENCHYIALGYLNGEDVVCLNTFSKELVYLKPNSIVREIEDWYVTAFHRSFGTIIKGSSLKQIP